MVKKTVAKAYNTALWLYDLTGGMRIGKRHRRISIDEAMAHMPTLNRDLLVAGFLYYDAQADDATFLHRPRRLSTAAVAANCSPVVASPVKGRQGATRALPAKRLLPVRGRRGVNAAGVWVDGSAHAARQGAIGLGTCAPPRGPLTVAGGAVRCDIAAVLPVPGDRRSVFVDAIGATVYVGTTDTDYDGSLDDPQCTAADIDYLLAALNAWLTKPVGRTRYSAPGPGLRPLVGGAGRPEGSRAQAAVSRERRGRLPVSRRHSVRMAPSGLVTGRVITDWPWPRTPREAAGPAARRGGRVRPVRRTPGGPRPTPARPRPRCRPEGYASEQPTSAGGPPSGWGIDAAVLEHLVGRYGGACRAVVAMVRDRRARRAGPSRPQAALPEGGAVYAVRYEMARTVDDVLARRTRSLLLARDASAAAAVDVAHLIAPELGWTPQDVDRQVTAYLGLQSPSGRRPISAGTGLTADAGTHALPTAL